MQVCTDVPLAPLTTLRLGGPARRLVEATTADEVVEAVADADRRGEPLLLLGGGSNVVLPDEGVDGTVVLVRSRGIARQAGPDGRGLLTVQAGEPWDDLVTRCVADRLAGIEALAGIPGLTGATPVQNVGAYGQEVAQTVRRVRAYDRVAREVVDMQPAECRFAYRDSRFKHEPGRWVVLEVDFALRPGGVGEPVRYAELARALGVAVGAPAPLDDVRAAVLALRRGKGMVLDPDDPDTTSAGSFFTNPVLDADAYAVLARRVGVEPPGFPEPDGRVKVPAAWLIGQAGFTKGYGDGQVRISSKHTLALTNRGGARTADLLALAREVRDAVRARCGVDLVPEPVIVGGAL